MKKSDNFADKHRTTPNNTKNGRVSKRELPPQASHRTVRESLDSYGSYHSVMHRLNSNEQSSWGTHFLYALASHLLF